MDVKLINLNTGETVMEAEALSINLMSRDEIAKAAQKNLADWQNAFNNLMDFLDSIIGVEVFCPEEYLGAESGFGTEIKIVSVINRENMTVNVHSNHDNQIHELSVGELADIIAEFGFVEE